MTVARCEDCKRLTNADPCPGCGKVVCPVCAEREGEFCWCIDEDGNTPEQRAAALARKASP